MRMLSGAPVTPGYTLVAAIATPAGSASQSARMEVIHPDAPLGQRFGPPPEPSARGSQPGQMRRGRRRAPRRSSATSAKTPSRGRERTTGTTCSFPA
ncbi:exported hypothetical protein [Candidatus Sulfopaludibacter sp. SbA3]|nr:exported hypothetical protein [Candidatus Sulfopaludibacter sp. SbA3]